MQLEEEERIRKRIQRQKEEEERITELITKILTLIQQVRPNIQIQLSRIIELSNGRKDEVESYLKQILKNDPTLGEYLELEQIFVRTTVDISDNQITESVTSVTSSRFNIADALQTCPNCKETQSVLIHQCANCSNDLPYCHICKQGFTESQQTLNCPHCENSYHRNHLFAYIQSHGQCALCREGLTLGQFEK
jgi:hypothetical protein